MSNDNDIPKQTPAWACKRWTFEDHDWTSCPSCQAAYQVHVQVENDPDQRGLLHWWNEEEQEVTACGSPSSATTKNLVAAHSPTDEVIDGVLRHNPRVTCPHCLDYARSKGHEVDIPFHKEPFQHG